MTTSRPQDFRKYEELGDYHWRSTTGNWRQTSPVDLARYRCVTRAIRRHLVPGNSRIGVDLGCGDGVLLELLARADLKAIGLDGTWEGVALAYDRIPVATSVLQGSLCDVPIRSESVGFAAAVEVIEHLDDVDSFLAETQRVLQPGSPLVVTTPTRRDTLRDTYHVKEYDAGDLENALRRKFSHVTVHGLFHSFLLRPYMNGLGVLPATKALRAAVKVAVRAGVNPFEMEGKHPDQRWDSLLAVAIK